MSAIKLVRVGSDVSNDVVINHDAISANHLELFQIEKSFSFSQMRKTK